MKRFFVMMLAMAMMGTTVYAAEPSVQERSLYMSISKFGRIEYILDQNKIDTYTAFIADYLQENGQDTGESYRYKGDFYRIILHSAEDRESYLTPYVDNASKVYTIYSKPVVEVAVGNEEPKEIWLTAEEQKELYDFAKNLFVDQFHYEKYFNFGTENPAELGVILNNRDLYFFKDAYIAANGKIYVSLEDWNEAFLKQYGNTKQLSYQNGKIICDYQEIDIVPVLNGGIAYVPLRETVDAFEIFYVKWDVNLKKAVIYEKWHDLYNEG